MNELGFEGYIYDYLEHPQGMENYLQSELNLHRIVRSILYLLDRSIFDITITLSPLHAIPDSRLARPWSIWEGPVVVSSSMEARTTLSPAHDMVAEQWVI